MRINKGELVVPSLMLMFMGAYYFQVRNIPHDVLRWPFFVAIALFFSLAAVFFVYVRTPTPSKDAKSAEWRKPVVLVAATTAYLWAMPYIGYSICSFLYLLGIQIYLGSSFKKALVVSAAIVFLLHAVLIEGLRMPVPRLITPYFIF